MSRSFFMTKKLQCLFANQSPFPYITHPHDSYYFKGFRPSRFTLKKTFLCKLLIFNQLQFIFKNYHFFCLQCGDNSNQIVIFEVLKISRLFKGKKKPFLSKICSIVLWRIGVHFNRQNAVQFIGH